MFAAAHSTSWGVDAWPERGACPLGGDLGDDGAADVADPWATKYFIRSYVGFNVTVRNTTTNGDARLLVTEPAGP